MVFLGVLLDSSLPPPPPGTNYLSVIKPALIFVLINATFAASLVPIFGALLLFSTPLTRRSLIFHFDVLALILGIGQGLLLLIFEVSRLLICVLHV